MYSILPNGEPCWIFSKLSVISMVLLLWRAIVRMPFPNLLYVRFERISYKFEEKHRHSKHQNIIIFVVNPILIFRIIESNSSPFIQHCTKLCVSHSAIRQLPNVNAQQVYTRHALNIRFRNSAKCKDLLTYRIQLRIATSFIPFAIRYYDIIQKCPDSLCYFAYWHWHWLNNKDFHRRLQGQWGSS